MSKKVLSAEDKRAAANVKALYNKYKQWCRSRGIKVTQERFAQDNFKITQANFSAYLNGHHKIGYDMTMKFAEVFGVNFSDIRPEAKDRFIKVNPVVLAEQNEEMLAEIEADIDNNIESDSNVE